MIVLALPPPLEPRFYAVAAAKRRGISLSRIGLALGGVYHARVSEIISKFEMYHGRCRVPAKSRISRGEGTKQVFTCAFCGAMEWQWSSKKHEVFCSSRCRNLSERALTREEVYQAINMRHRGETWRSVALLFRRNYQLIQVSIWRTLYEDGQLTRDTLNDIWLPTSAPKTPRAGSWAWLEDHYPAMKRMDS